MQTMEPAYDLCVIGAGMAGMAAAVFAANRGLRTAVCGSVGGIDFSTGPLDLLAVHPVDRRTVWDDPWQALAALVRERPEHPYALVGEERIRAAMDEFCAFLAAMGLEYLGHSERNARMLTPAGTLKCTWRVPKGMWNGVLALERKAPCLIVGFKGLKGFSSRQVAEVRRPHWPGLRHVLMNFPRFRGELYVEHLAMSLTDPEMRRALAESVAPHVRDAAFVGFPASLGLYGGEDVQTHLEQLLGVPIFEIPTLPPSLAGLRLKAAFETHLPRHGVTVYSQQLVRGAESLSTEQGGGFRLRIVGQGAANHQEPREPERWIRAMAAIHAGGRFFGKGLVAERGGIREAVFGLPVRQPESREGWHRDSFFTAGGHPVNSVGLEVDARFRPLDSTGRPVHANLFAAGSILAHQDWMRQKCGAGLAIATAYAAVEAALEWARRGILHTMLRGKIFLADAGSGSRT